jgi:hypothetical protein
MILEIFGPLRSSSLPGLWRGLVATKLLLIVAVVFLPSYGCVRTFVGAILVASALSVARRGTPPRKAAIYGSMVGLVVGASAATGSRAGWWDYLAASLAGALVGGAISGATYWAEAVVGPQGGG